MALQGKVVGGDRRAAYSPPRSQQMLQGVSGLFGGISAGLQQRKAAERQYEQQLMAAALPTLAANNMLEPAKDGVIKLGGQSFNIRPQPVSEEDAWATQKKKFEALNEELEFIKNNYENENEQEAALKKLAEDPNKLWILTQMGYVDKKGKVDAASFVADYFGTPREGATRAIVNGMVAAARQNPAYNGVPDNVLSEQIMTGKIQPAAQAPDQQLVSALPGVARGAWNVLGKVGDYTMAGARGLERGLGHLATGLTPQGMAANMAAQQQMAAQQPGPPQPYPSVGSFGAPGAPGAIPPSMTVATPMPTPQQRR